ncbi:substrate-binding domain-containing protein, partial [Streptomyces boncukensis]
PGPSAPTALVCDGDLLAAGALKAARRLGLRVPEELSVTGFDDLALARIVEPELTTLHLPAAEMGAAGMRALLAVLDAGRTDPGHADARRTGARRAGPGRGRRDGRGDQTQNEGDRETVLPVTLVPRDSSGPAPE